MASDILQHVFAKCFDTDRSISDRVAHGVLGVMVKECEKSWWKLDNYFDFFEKLMVGGLSFISKESRNEIVTYFKGKRIISLLFNLITKAPSDYQSPPFRKVLNLVMSLVQ